MKKMDLMNYVLIKREIEMGSKQELTEEEQILVNKVEKICELDEYIKNKIESLMSTTSINNARNIINTKKEEPAKRQIIEQPLNEKENTKVYTLKPINVNKAGFIDALIMALVSGFVSGIAVTILYMMI